MSEPMTRAPGTLTWHDDGQAQFYLGDARAVLAELPCGSAQTCVTSPPYFGLRDYGVEGQIGLEPTPAAYVATLVDVFREVRRVLRDDGTLWLNLGDSYARNGGEPGGGNRELLHLEGTQTRMTCISEGSRLKPKDLIGIPWAVAFALRDDGWYLRSDIIWSKPNPMPESVHDRPTKAHEYLFLLAKSERYHYDAAAIAEPCTEEFRLHGHRRPGIDPLYVETGNGGAGRYRAGLNRQGGGHSTRNKRTVWTITPEAFRPAHFATFPPDLVRPCVLAGSKDGDTIIDPFVGSGTVAMVAKELGRKSIGIDINEEYLEMARRRCSQMGLFLEASNA